MFALNAKCERTEGVCVFFNFRAQCFQAGWAVCVQNYRSALLTVVEEEEEEEVGPLSHEARSWWWLPDAAVLWGALWSLTPEHTAHTEPRAGRYHSILWMEKEKDIPKKKQKKSEREWLEDCFSPLVVLGVSKSSGLSRATSVVALTENNECIFIKKKCNCWFTVFAKVL